jgi:hypothetical protein
MTWKFRPPSKKDPKPIRKTTRARQLELVIPPRTARYSMAVEEACEAFKKRMVELGRTQI